MRLLVLETLCGLYVGQRTAETRAEAPVRTQKAAAQRAGGNDGERLSRGRCVGVRAEADGRKAATTSFAVKGGIKCVLAGCLRGGRGRGGLAGSSADTSTA